MCTRWLGWPRQRTLLAIPARSMDDKSEVNACLEHHSDASTREGREGRSDSSWECLISWSRVAGVAWSLWPKKSDVPVDAAATTPMPGVLSASASAVIRAARAIVFLAIATTAASLSGGRSGGFFRALDDGRTDGGPMCTAPTDEKHLRAAKAMPPAAPSRYTTISRTKSRWRNLDSSDREEVLMPAWARGARAPSKGDRTAMEYGELCLDTPFERNLRAAILPGIVGSESSPPVAYAELDEPDRGRSPMPPLRCELGVSPLPIRPRSPLDAPKEDTLWFRFRWKLAEDLERGSPALGALSDPGCSPGAFTGRSSEVPGTPSIDPVLQPRPPALCDSRCIRRTAALVLSTPTRRAALDFQASGACLSST